MNWSSSWDKLGQQFVFFIFLCCIFNRGNELLWVSPSLPGLQLGDFFGVGILGSCPSLFLWSSMQRAFLKGTELVSSSSTSSMPGDVYEPAPTSFRGISESFRSQVLPTGLTAGQFTSTNWMVRGRECRFLLFPLCRVYSLGPCCIKMFVSDTGSSFYFVKPKPQVSDVSWSCSARGWFKARSRYQAYEVFFLFLVFFSAICKSRL